MFNYSLIIIIINNQSQIERTIYSIIYEWTIASPAHKIGLFHGRNPYRSTLLIFKDSFPKNKHFSINVINRL